MGNIVQIKDIRPIKDPGKHYRLLCMTGDNKGISYYLKEARVIMGRSEKADIQIADTKSSREHVELKKVKNDYIATDLGSHNGIIINDLKVTQHKLTNGDVVVIGQTVYKYNVFSNEEKDKADTEEEVEKALAEDKKIKFGSSAKSNKKTEKKRSKLMIPLILVLGWLLLEEEESVVKKIDKTGSNDATNQLVKLANSRNNKIDLEKSKQIKIFLHRGQRELREGNYYRALSEFKAAKLMDARNSQANYYEKRAIQALDQEIEKNFIKAQQEMEALKYKSASVSYCTIIRLLEGYDKEDRYKDAKANLEVVEEKLGMEKGEIKCL